MRCCVVRACTPAKVQPALGGQAVGGDDIAAVTGDRQREAGQHPAAVNEHLARATLPRDRTILHADDVEALAQPARTLQPRSVSRRLIRSSVRTFVRAGAPLKSVTRDLIWQPSLLDGIRPWSWTARSVGPSAALTDYLWADDAWVDHVPGWCRGRRRAVRRATSGDAVVRSRGARCTTGCCRSHGSPTAGRSIAGRPAGADGDGTTDRRPVRREARLHLPDTSPRSASTSIATAPTAWPGMATGWPGSYRRQWSRWCPWGR